MVNININFSIIYRISALDISDFRLGMFQQIKECEGGCWASSYNCHGYMLYTLWNVTDDEVKVFYFNFAYFRKESVDWFLEKSEKYVEELEIKPVIHLQDGECFRVHSTLPLFHFVVAMTKHIDSTSLITTARVNPMTIVHSALVFCEAMQKQRNMYNCINGAMEALKNHKRASFRFNDSIFDDDTRIEFLQHLVAQLPNPGMLTAKFVEPLFKALQKISNRKNVIDHEALKKNAQEIVELIAEFEKIYFSKQYVHFASRNKLTQNHFAETCQQYKQLFTKNPLVPYEVLLFIFEYEVSGFPRQKDFVLRLSIGKIYQLPNPLNIWCGTTDKRVIYPKINITAATQKQLLENVLKKQWL